jgi:hypothetical protein
MRDRRSINCYDVLGVDRTSTADDIKAAYRARVSAAHPDHNCSANAAAVTARLNEAWHVLGDPARRRAYDAEMCPYPAVTSGAALPRPSSYIVTSRDVTNSRSGCLTVSTGHDAVRTTRSATLPTSNWATVPRPCVPMTMRLMFADLA